MSIDLDEKLFEKYSNLVFYANKKSFKNRAKKTKKKFF